MMSKVQFQKYLQRFRQKRTKVPDRRLMHPLRDWLIGLAVCVLLLFGGVGYAVNQFFTYDNLESSIEPVRSSSLRYNQIDAETARSVYTERVSDFSVLLGPTVVTDNTDEEILSDGPVLENMPATSTASATQETVVKQVEEGLDENEVIDEEFVPTSF